ncbi:MAG: methylenetetrahydrofolate reductase [NAD(P)H] [Proteobacteria bacterium]|nr:methylenetetrahydrofolate reductase [NAD(P)H] [Pseudomonadota bacterium]
MTDRLFSFEFSAPKSEDAIAKVKKVHARLAALSPHFFSVTYGAGGSTKDGTRQMVMDLAGTGSTVAPHLSFGGDDPGVIQALLESYREAGIRRLVALRGDRPSGIGGALQMTHANELVSFIRDTTGDHFHIDVAAYPEMHPESSSFESEIAYFKQKIDAGANSAITQYFYNSDAYFHFVNACAKAGINVPIVPGIMPITNYQGIVRFSSLCGAEIPRWIEKHLVSYQDDPESLRNFGDEVVTRLCEQLLAGGAPGLHFYTLNQAAPTLRIWNNLGL